MRACVSLCLVALLSCFAQADNPTAGAPDHLLPEAESAGVQRDRETVVYRLENVAAEKAGQALNDKLQPIVAAKPRHEGFLVDSPVVIVPEKVTNTLIICAESDIQRNSLL